MFIAENENERLEGPGRAAGRAVGGGILFILQIAFLGGHVHALPTLIIRLQVDLSRF